MSVADVNQLLADLGNTSDEVAAKLKSLGIKGLKDTWLNCPIARYLQEHGHWDYTVQSAGVLPKHIFWRRPFTPYAVCAFVKEFDEGKYPELEMSFSET